MKKTVAREFGIHSSRSRLNPVTRTQDLHSSHLFPTIRCDTFLTSLLEGSFPMLSDLLLFLLSNTCSLFATDFYPFHVVPEHHWWSSTSSRNILCGYKIFQRSTLSPSVFSSVCGLLAVSTIGSFLRFVSKGGLHTYNVLCEDKNF